MLKNAPLFALCLFLAACGGAATTITPGIPQPSPTSSPAAKSYLFVVEHALNQVAKIDPANGSAAATIPVGTAPVAIALHYTQTGSGTLVPADYAWVANSQSGSVSEINLTANAVVASVPVGTDPESVVVESADAGTAGTLLGKVYVANTGSNTVSIIDPASAAVIKTISTSSAPFQLAQSGRFLAIANGDGNLQFYDLSAQAFVNTIQVPGLAGVGTGVGLDVFVYASSTGSVMGLSATGATSAFPFANDPYPNLPAGVTHVSSGPPGTAVWLSNASAQTVTQLYESSQGNQTVAGLGPAPRGVATDPSGTTYVADSTDYTLSLFDNTFKLQPKIGLAANAQPYDVADAVVAPAAPSATPSASPSPSPSASPTAPPLNYNFTGGHFGPLNLSMYAGSTASICLACNATDYGNIGITQTWQVPVNSSGTLDFYSAYDTGDITPSLPVDNADATYTPVIYLMVNNSGSATATLGESPANWMLVGDRAGWGSMTACSFDVYAFTGSAYAWSHTGQLTTISGPTANALFAGSGSVTFAPGESIAAITCR